MIIKFETLESIPLSPPLHLWTPFLHLEENCKFQGALILQKLHQSLICIQTFLQDNIIYMIGDMQRK